LLFSLWASSFGISVSNPVRFFFHAAHGMPSHGWTCNQDGYQPGSKDRDRQLFPQGHLANSFFCERVRVVARI
jgi:hypothetical protein